MSTQLDASVVKLRNLISSVVDTINEMQASQHRVPAPIKLIEKPKRARGRPRKIVSVPRSFTLAEVDWFGKAIAFAMHKYNKSSRFHAGRYQCVYQDDADGMMTRLMITAGFRQNQLMVVRPDGDFAAKFPEVHRFVDDTSIVFSDNTGVWNYVEDITDGMKTDIVQPPISLVYLEFDSILRCDDSVPSKVLADFVRWYGSKYSTFIMKVPARHAYLAENPTQHRDNDHKYICDIVEAESEDKLTAVVSNMRSGDSIIYTVGLRRKKHI